jgi:tetraacyldisaccharide 4'-kinase
VVSVGNLTLGGTGKTPMVEWIARWLQQRGVRAAVISRGYGAAAGSANDEAMELRERLPEVPHLQNPDRVAAARKAVGELGCQAIVLDDAFQHRRIARDLDIVLLDALEPFGFGHVFPRGTLREPISGLRRADLVVLSRAGMLGRPARDAIRQQVAQLAPKAAWAEADHGAQGLRNAGGKQQPIESLARKAVAAFCGVGNPAGFRHTLQLCGYRVIAFREFADHYRYTRAVVESLIAWAENLEVEAVVCTHKDLVKLEIDNIGRRPLWAVKIALEFSVGQADLEAKLSRLACV